MLGNERGRGGEGEREGEREGRRGGERGERGERRARRGGGGGEGGREGEEREGEGGGEGERGRGERGRGGEEERKSHTYCVRIQWLGNGCTENGRVGAHTVGLCESLCSSSIVCGLGCG